MFTMKRTIFSQLQLFLIVAVFCVLSQSFKLPTDLRKLSQETQMQLQLEREEQSHDTPKKVLRFPEQSHDRNVVVDYGVPISFRNNGNDSEQREIKTDTNERLKMFYQHSNEHQTKSEESIIFPGMDNIDSFNDKKQAGSNDGISQVKPVNKPGMGLVFKESQDFPNNETNFMYSLETLAKMVRQLLFHTSAPLTDATQRPIPFNVVQSSDNNTPSPEMDVSEQSLYSGPKIRTESQSDNCPEGTKKTRNGSCQKPSRRLIS